VIRARVFADFCRTAVSGRWSAARSTAAPGAGA